MLVGQYGDSASLGGENALTSNGGGQHEFPVWSGYLLGSGGQKRDR
jgi:hypothetical protein